MSLTSQIRYCRALDSTATDGSGKTGLAFGDFTAKYLTEGGTLTSLTTETITTLGTYQAPTDAAHLRIKELSSADPTKGIYEVHFHDTQLVGSGKKLWLFLSASGAAIQPLEVDLTPYLDGDATSAADFKDFVDTGYDPSTHHASADVQTWLTGTIPAPNVTGVPLVDAKYVTGTLQTAGDLYSLITSIATATNAGDLTSKTADSGAIISSTGTVVSGTYVDTASSNSTYWITAPVSPAVGGFGLRQSLVFNLPLGRIPISFEIKGYWNGSGKTAEVYALNSRTGVYDQLTNSATDLTSKNADNTYVITIPRDYGDDSGGSFNIVTIELRSTSVTTANRLRIDRALVYHVAESAAVSLTAPTVDQIWSAPSRTLTDNGSTPATPPTTADITAAMLAAAYEGSETFQDFMRLARAALVGKVSGMATNAPKFRDAADSKDRISATTDSSGNRSAVTTDAT